MKLVAACALLALFAISSIEANPWGKYVQVTVNKQYDGPNLADVVSRLVRQKMDFKNSLWNAFMNAKSKSYTYNYSYNHQPAYTKTVKVNYESSNNNHKEVEVETQPPIPKKVVKVAPLVEHEKTFEFNAKSTFSSSSSSSGSSSSGNAAVHSSSGSDSNSDLVDIADHQKDNN